jgi:hypothetical protein
LPRLLARTIIFSPTPPGTGNNVVFNLQPPNQTGTTIFGNINSVGTLVQFTSNQTLATPSAGQARIESVPDGVLNNLVTTIPGFFFDEAVFNLDATANGSASISAFDQSGSLFSFTLPLSGNGQNFFHHTTANGQLISRVAFTTTVGLDDVAQVRFGNTAVFGPIVGAGLPGSRATGVLRSQPIRPDPRSAVLGQPRDMPKVRRHVVWGPAEVCSVLYRL